MQIASINTRSNVTPNLPVEQNQLAVDRQRSTLLGRVDARFQIEQPFGVTGWGGREGNGLIGHGASFTPP